MLSIQPCEKCLIYLFYPIIILFYSFIYFHLFKMGRRSKWVCSSICWFLFPRYLQQGWGSWVHTPRIPLQSLGCLGPTTLSSQLFLPRIHQQGVRLKTRVARTCASVSSGNLTCCVTMPTPAFYFYSSGTCVLMPLTAVSVW